MYKTLFQTTIPVFTVVIRRCYGIGGSILIGCRDPSIRVAWFVLAILVCQIFLKACRPSGEWGSIPLDGGIEGKAIPEAGIL